jgi:hypothetical protein
MKKENQMMEGFPKERCGRQANGGGAARVPRGTTNTTAMTCEADANGIPPYVPRPFGEVWFTGPEPVKNKDGDEVPCWHVCARDVQGLIMSKVYGVYDYAKAQALAQHMATDRNCVLISEATQP